MYLVENEKEGLLSQAIALSVEEELLRQAIALSLEDLI